MRIIAHLDMDAFFAAVEEHDSPQFRGMPLVIGADPKNGKGRGVVSTANYKAREFGIHSALPISKAWELAQAAIKRGEQATVFLPGNFRRYGEISDKIMSVIGDYAKEVEQVSVDEAYFDLSFAGSFEKAELICREIKKEVKNKTGLTASVGLAPNKLIAKIASDAQKPDGMTVVTEAEAEKFLEPLAIRKIPGIGPKTEMLLVRKAVMTVKDLKKLSEATLYDMLGEWGLELYEKVRGHDDAPIVEEYEAKSIGEQKTFEEDTDDPRIVVADLSDMAENIIKSFGDSGFKTFKRIVLTVRFSDFKTCTRSHTLPEPESGVKIFKKEILKLILPFFDSRENPNHKLIRLVGTRIEGLV
jgi:DNA polymerase IV (DinB-like DNA polymerase)